MTEKEKGHFAQKHPGIEPDEKIAPGIRYYLQEGGLFCALGFKIAQVLSIKAIEVGRTADLMEVPILKCQLGLFGYPPEKKIVKPADSVEPDLETAIQKELVNGRISCAAVFALSEKLRIPKMKIASACEKLGIKINACQLGAF